MSKHMMSSLLAAVLLCGGVAWAQMGPGYGYGMGPGMMGGYGPGQGGGYGPGYGMGPGMMGPGMMGPGMMGGYGMGPGMMWGGPGTNLNLTDDQHAKIAAIQDDLGRKQWDLMGQMNDEQYRLQDLYASGKRDEAAIKKSYQRMAELRRQMFDTMIDGRKKLESVLTKEQQNQLRRGWRGGWGMGW